MGTSRRVEEGQLVVRRGQHLGEVMLVHEGRFQAMDATARPAVVYADLVVGDVIGERGFIDGGAATTDVRAQTAGLVRVWQCSSLTDAFDQDSVLAAAVWQAFARDAAERARSFAAAPVRSSLAERAESHPDVGAVTEVLRAALADAEIHPDCAEDALVSAFGRVHEQLERLDDHTARVRVGAAAWKALRADLVGAGLVEALRGRAGLAPPGEAQAHLQAGRPVGGTPLSEAVDSALLHLPTARALRASVRLACDYLSVSVQAGQRWVGLGLDGGDATVRLEDAVVAAGGSLRGASEPASTLALLEAGGAPLAPASGVLLHGVFEAVPDRVLVRWVRGLFASIAPNGPVAVVALGETPDTLAWEHLLGWPLVRRSAAATAALLIEAGLSNVAIWREGRHAASLVVGHVPVGGPS